MKAQNARPSCCCCFWRRWCPDASPLIPWPVAVAAIFEAASDAEWKVCALRGNKAASRRSAVSGRRHLPQQMQQMWQLCNGLWQLRSLPRTVQIDLPESIIRTSSTMENLSAIFLAIAVRTDRVSSASSASSLLISCPPFPVRTLSDKCLAICCRLTPFRHKSQTNCPIACADSYGDRWDSPQLVFVEEEDTLQLGNLLSAIRQCLLIAYINIYCHCFCR